MKSFFTTIQPYKFLAFWLKTFSLCVIAILVFTNTGLSQTVWSEDWEGNWVVDWHVDGGTWEVGIPTSGPNSAYNGQNCAATVLAGDYTEPVDSRLIRHTSFVVPTVSENPRFRFWYWFSFSDSDWGEVQIKTSYGEWETISNRMNNYGSNAWSYASVDISAYADSTVQIAFYFHSQQSGSGADISSGWYIDDVSLVTGPYVLNSPEGFESGFGDWSVDEGTWEVGIPTSGPDSAYNGQNSAGTNLEGNYQEPADSRLVSPPFVVPTVSENPRFRFWYWFSFSDSDWGEVQIKTSYGAWESISIVMNNYGSNAWSYGSVDISAYADSTVQIAFYFHSQQSGSGADISSGWYIDDVSLVTGPYVLNSPEGFESGFGDWSVDEGTWEVGIPTSGPDSAYNGQNSAGTNLEGNYQEPADSRLVSPPFVVPTVSENPRFRFWYWFSFSDSDWGEVQIKTSYGAWESISIVMNNYGSNAWSYGSVDISAYADSTVQIAFYFHSQQSGSGADISSGWYIDDVSLVTGPYVLNSPEGFESGFGDWSVDEGTWEVGIPTSGPDSAYNGQNSAGTNLEGNYQEPADSRLVSPPFVVPTVSENPRFRFWYWFSFSDSDWGEVQIKTSYGAWESISIVMNNYGSNAWSYGSVDISAYADSTVQIAFYFHSQQSGSGADISSGWYIDDVSLVTGPYVLNSPEGFESGFGDWSVDEGTWEVGIPTSGPDSAYNGQNSAGTNLEGNYQEPADSRLVSPPFVVPAASENPAISFWHWFSFSDADYGVVQIRVNNGNWQAISSQFIGTSGSVWTPFYVSLLTYADSTVQIALKFHSQQSGSGTDVSSGWYIDDISITGIISTIALTLTVDDGWNMVSVPGINPAGMDVDTWWSGKDPAAGVFKYASGYVEVTTTMPSEGYWMKNSGAQVYNYAAIEIVPHSDVPLALGWNLIGLYESTVAVPLTTTPPGIITTGIFEYSGGYTTATSLVPGYGYWVKADAAGSITGLAALPLGKGNGEVLEYFKEDWGKIILTDASGINYTLYAVTGQVDLDKYELPPMPPAGMFDIRYGSGRIAEDLNSSLQEIQMTGVTYPLTVRVEGMDMRLMDETGKTVNVNLKSGEDVVISDATIQKLMVTGELVPAAYALEQNYPNPFNPSTTIEFSLPEDVSIVKLSIYNALGEKVAELVNGSLVAGKYQYQWNAKNVATGIYIYELRTDKFTSIKKMILLK